VSVYVVVVVDRECLPFLAPRLVREVIPGLFTPPYLTFWVIGHLILCSVYYKMFNLISLFYSLDASSSSSDKKVSKGLGM
jgi:hypothetical protein